MRFSSRIRSPSVLRRLYTLIGPLYNHVTALLSSRARRTGLAHLAAAEGERILEVGTGPGRTFLHLLRARSSGWTDGLDVTPAMLRRTRRRAARVSHNRYRLRHGVASDLPYPSGRYDALFSAYLLDVLPSPHIPTALLEMRRVLHHDGRLVLVTMAPPHHWWERVWAQAVETMPLLLGGSRPLQIQPRLRRAGFQIRRHVVRRQAGLPSAVTTAVPAARSVRKPSN